MTATAPAPPTHDTPLARRSTVLHDLATIAKRACRGVFREPEFFIPALIVPVFFFVVNIGALQDFAEQSGTVVDFKAFQLPVSIIFAVTGVSRASALVTDIQGGYFDRLLLTPIRRPALLLGLMAADLMAVMMLAVPVLLLGLVLGVNFTTGFLGMIVFLFYGAFWGLAFAGFPYAIALKTGNPAAVNSSFILFFPFAFLTTSFLPKEALTGWLSTIATYNPVTYVLDGLRSLITDGWEWATLAKGLAATLALAVVQLQPRQCCDPRPRLAELSHPPRLRRTSRRTGPSYSSTQTPWRCRHLEKLSCRCHGFRDGLLCELHHSPPIHSGGPTNMLLQNSPFRDLDSLFDFAGSGRSPSRAMPMDAYRRDDNVWVHIDLPGVAADSIDISVERNVLTVTAERNTAREDGDRFYLAERHRGTFRRQVNLGEGLDAEAHRGRLPRRRADAARPGRPAGQAAQDRDSQRPTRIRPGRRGQRLRRELSKKE